MTDGHLISDPWSFIMKRARKPEQKEERREAILTAGWTLFREQAFTDISMSGVAAQANVAKGTLYLYFKTKEELFLAILTEKYSDFFGALNAHLPQFPPTTDEFEYGRQLARFLVQHPHMLRLMGIAPLMLEHNSDDDAIRAYKEVTLLNLGQTGGIFEAVTDFFPAGSGPQFVLDVYTVILGVHQITNIPQNVAELIEQEPHLNLFNIDQEEYLAHMIGTHLRGLTHENQDKPRGTGI